jgi:hypothetical protein
MAFSKNKFNEIIVIMLFFINQTQSCWKKTDSWLLFWKTFLFSLLTPVTLSLTLSVPFSLFPLSLLHAFVNAHVCARAERPNRFLKSYQNHKNTQSSICRRNYFSFRASSLLCNKCEHLYTPTHTLTFTHTHTHTHSHAHTNIYATDTSFQSINLSLCWKSRWSQSWKLTAMFYAMSERKKVCKH